MGSRETQPRGSGYHALWKMPSEGNGQSRRLWEPGLARTSGRGLSEGKGALERLNSSEVEVGLLAGTGSRRIPKIRISQSCSEMMVIARTKIIIPWRGAILAKVGLATISNPTPKQGDPKGKQPKRPLGFREAMGSFSAAGARWNNGEEATTVAFRREGCIPQGLWFNATDGKGDSRESPTP